LEGLARIWNGWMVGDGWCWLGMVGVGWEWLGWCSGFPECRQDSI